MIITFWHYNPIECYNHILSFPMHPLCLQVSIYDQQRSFQVSSTNSPKIKDINTISTVLGNKVQLIFWVSQSVPRESTIDVARVRARYNNRFWILWEAQANSFCKQVSVSTSLSFATRHQSLIFSDFLEDLPKGGLPPPQTPPDWLSWN